jgi:hypothetical protein
VMASLKEPCNSLLESLYYFATLESKDDQMRESAMNSSSNTQPISNSVCVCVSYDISKPLNIEMLQTSAHVLLLFT